MRICFVVNNPRTQRATYTTLHLAFAAYRRGHDVAFASVDAFSQGEGADIVAEVVRPKSGRLRDAAAYVKALTAADAPREDARLVDFDVIFLRNNPSRGRRGGGRVQPGARLRPPAQAARACWWSTTRTACRAPARRCTWPAFRSSYARRR